MAEIEDSLRRIAAALERLAPPPATALALDEADAFGWEARAERLRPVPRVAGVPFDLLCGIERAAETLFDNTNRFATGLPANNALLWGARGMGKSSLVKAVHGRINERDPGCRLALIEIHREDIESLPRLLQLLAPARALPAVLRRPELRRRGDELQVAQGRARGRDRGPAAERLFYATSNRRHLMPRQMIDNERSTAVIPGEAVEEKVSLSDRFGLWLGFHPCSQETYLAMVARYVEHFRPRVEPELPPARRSSGP
jgi:predicted AAA+ superfamily ATPase